MTKTCNFITRMKQTRCMGCTLEEQAYNFDKMSIKIFEGQLRNPVRRKLVQKGGSIFII